MSTYIVGTDLSEHALQAARFAIGCARASDDADSRVVITRVVKADDMNMRRVIANHSEARERIELRQQVQQWLSAIDTDQVRCDIEIEVGTPADILADMARDLDADGLVVGKSGKGRLARFFVGSTTEHLALRPPCPMAVVHPDGFVPGQPLRALSAVDLSRSSVDGVAHAADLARRFDGALNILHVISMPRDISPVIDGPDPLPETLETHLGEQLGWARQELDTLLADVAPDLDDVSPTIDIHPGYPIHEVLEVLKERDANLLTLGSHGRSRFADMMLGSTGRTLLKKAPCTVLLTPPDTTRSRSAGDKVGVEE